MSLADKYDTTRHWEAPCDHCGKPVDMCAATWQVKGTVHDGCAGYPFCSCVKSHEGECTRETMGLPPPSTGGSAP